MPFRMLALSIVAALLCACANQADNASISEKIRALKPCQHLGSPDLPMRDESVSACVAIYRGVMQRAYQSWVEGYPVLPENVVMHIEADPSGAITKVTTSGQKDIPAAVIARLEDFFRQYVLLPPSSGGWSGAHPMELDPPLSTNGQPPSRKRILSSGPAGSKCANLGSRDSDLKEEDVRTCMERYSNLFILEYQRWLDRGTMLNGVVVLGITASTDGELTSVVVMPDTDIDKNFAERIAGIVKAHVKLPPSRNGWNNKYMLNFFPS